MIPRAGEGDRTLWVVLGGGGLKGLAHIGAWRAITEAGLVPGGIVGTSVGSLVAVLLASGRGWEELAEIAGVLERPDILRVNRRVVWLNGIRAESVFQEEPFRGYLDGLLPAL